MIKKELKYLGSPESYEQSFFASFMQALSNLYSDRFHFRPREVIPAIKGAVKQ